MAMYGIESFRAKLEFAERFTRVYVEDKPGMLKRWEGVPKVLVNANRWRNQVVHQSKRVFPRAAPGRRVVLVQVVENATTSEPSPEHAIGIRKLVKSGCSPLRQGTSLGVSGDSCPMDVTSTKNTHL